MAMIEVALTVDQLKQLRQMAAEADMTLKELFSEMIQQQLQSTSS